MKEGGRKAEEELENKNYKQVWVFLHGEVLCVWFSWRIRAKIMNNAPPKT